MAGRSRLAAGDNAQNHLQHQNGDTLQHRQLPSPPRPAGAQEQKVDRTENRPIQTDRRDKDPRAAATRQHTTALTSAPPEAAPREGESRTLFTLYGRRAVLSAPPGTKPTLTTGRETRNQIPTTPRRRSDERGRDPASLRRGEGEFGLASLFAFGVAGAGEGIRPSPCPMEADTLCSHLYVHAHT